MPKIIHWGILGAGRIAGKFASDLRLVDDAKLVAVGSRSMAGANAFADEFNIPNRHDSYEALVNNPGVDIVYIATPHNLHCENTLLCLSHNKAVLCEKPFAMNARQVHKMVSLAKEKKVFLMEALWSKFLPQFNKVKQMIGGGMIGEIQSIRADFGFKPTPPFPARLFDPELGGGTIMDIGIYNVFIAISLLGKPDFIDAVMIPAHTGVDLQCAVTFRYNNGAMAQLFSTNASNTATEADISGTEGRIRMTSRFHELTAGIQFTPGKSHIAQEIPFEKEEGSHGYQYEARHAGECLRTGLIESPVMSWQDSVDLIETLDAIRKAAGIHYPADDE